MPSRVAGWYQPSRRRFSPAPGYFWQTCYGDVVYAQGRYWPEKLYWATLKRIVNSFSIWNHVRNEQCCCSAAEWLQEVLQKSCKSAGLQQPQILTAVQSPLTAIDSAFAAVQKIPESRSTLQSGFEKTKNVQNVVTGNGLPLVTTKKRNVGSNNTIITIHGRGVDKALVAE